MVLPSNLPSFVQYTDSGGTPASDNNITDMQISNYYTKVLYNANKLKDISQNNINLERNAEVSMYYYLKYNKQIYLLKLIIFTCCLALIGAIMYSKSILSSSMFTYYLGVVFGIGAIFILYNIYDIYIRDTINYNEYDYQYKPPMPDELNSNLANLTTTQLANMDPKC
jgi:hypothetical protein